MTNPNTHAIGIPTRPPLQHLLDRLASRPRGLMVVVPHARTRSTAFSALTACHARARRPSAALPDGRLTATLDVAAWLMDVGRPRLIRLGYLHLALRIAPLVQPRPWALVATAVFSALAAPRSLARARCGNWYTRSLLSCSWAGGRGTGRRGQTRSRPTIATPLAAISAVSAVAWPAGKQLVFCVKCCDCSTSAGKRGPGGRGLGRLGAPHSLLSRGAPGAELRAAPLCCAAT